MENTLLQRFPVQTPVETGTVGGNHCVLTVNEDFFCVFVFFFYQSLEYQELIILGKVRTYFFVCFAGLLTASDAGRVLVFLLSLCVLDTKRLFYVMFFC